MVDGGSSIRNIALHRESLDRVRKARGQRISQLPKDYLDELNAFRTRNLRDIHALVEAVRRAVEMAGGHFLLAEDAVQASNYVVDVVRRSGGRLVVKSKSMTTEELDLNHFLSSSGFEVVETDLGERVVQLAGDRPSHILAPAVHMTSADIARILSPDLKPNPSEIVSFMRRELRRYFLSADVGITGANAISAEDGSILIITNEGNDRLVTAIPRTYICIAGVEKLVSNIGEALKLVEIQAASATGQRLATYITLISPKSEGFGAERDFHLILVDNGRLKVARDTEMAETLKCIRCSACFNVCPTYRVVGGTLFGYRYTGPIGIPWTYATADLSHAVSISDLCISCGLCQMECPVKIDIPHLISVVKERAVKSGLQKPPPLARNYDRLLALSSRFPRLSNLLLRNSLARRLLGPILGIDRRRQLPPFPPQSLQKLLMKVEGPSEPVEQVALFTDSLIMYLYPRIGVEAVETLTRLGADFILPPQRGSGMPLIQNGLISEAREVAEKNVDVLARQVNLGREIVCLEPTAEYCIRKIYPKLLGTREAALVSSRTTCLFEYFLRRSPEFDGGRGSILYHWPCHGRDLHDKPPTMELLRKLGYDVTLLRSGCCGMAGVWGLRRFDLSESVAGEVIDAIRDAGGGLVVTDSTVCMLQLMQFYNGETRHAVSLLYENVRRLVS